jgi:hypothetical protein
MYGTSNILICIVRKHYYMEVREQHFMVTKWQSDFISVAIHNKIILPLWKDHRSNICSFDQ